MTNNTKNRFNHPVSGDNKLVIDGTFELTENSTFINNNSSLDLKTSNYTATSAPTVNDDSDDGYSVGSVWVDTTNDRSYTCMDSSVGSAVWKYVAGDSVSVKDFGAVGDGVTDDTAAFQAARDFWKANRRTNANPGSNSNKLSSISAIEVPPGDYLITSAGAMMDSSFAQRTLGMRWKGTSTKAATQIIYDPSVSGALFYNNDAILRLRIENMSFSCQDDASDLYYSISAGGAQDVGFIDCDFGGFRYGVHLQGTNNNSEMFWQNCGIFGHWDAFLYSETSDQFLNYWFTECKIWNLEGIFAKMTMGGHLKIDKCDFSIYAPTDDTSVIFALEGASHARGVTSFICRDTRFELETEFSKVIYSEWPFGVVSFENCDMSSQAGDEDAPTTLVAEFFWNNTRGSVVTFKNCDLMGLHKYEVGNSTWAQKHTVSYEDCDHRNFLDFYDMFVFEVTGGGSNTGGLPNPTLTRCRGLQGLYDAGSSWSASTAYDVDDIVRSGAWVYKCTVAGTSGTAASKPYGSGTVIDNTVTWVSEEIFQTHEWIQGGAANWEVGRTVQNLKKQVILRTGSGKWPASDGNIPNYEGCILPPNSIVTNITLDLPAGESSQGSAGTYRVVTDEATPTALLDHTSAGFLSAGTTASWSGNHNCGTDLTTRRLLFEAGTNAQDSGITHPAYLMIEYLCGGY